MQRSVRRSLVLLFVLLLLLLSAAVPGGLAEGDDPGDDHLSVTDPGDDPALQRKTKKSKRKKNQSGKNETERPKADARAKWDKSGDGSDGKDYWGMNNPNPGWDKYYAGAQTLRVEQLGERMLSPCPGPLQASATSS
jgi:hypothetical protein